MDKKTRIGIIGCGKQAPKHISGLRKIRGVELVLADLDSDAAERLGEEHGLPAARTPGSLFEDPSIAAVDICTPTPSHSVLIEKAISAGKDFFCEKPLCEDLATARRINDLVSEHGRIGMVGYIYRFSPVFAMARDLLKNVAAGGESLELGKIVTAFFRIGGRGSHQVWKHRKASGGGAINEMLVHMIDLALWFFGPVEDLEVLACDLLRPLRTINGKEEEVDAEDYVLVRLNMRCGVQVVCQADLVTPAFTQFVEIQGENGTFMGSIQQDMPSFILCKNEVGGFPRGKTPVNMGKRNLFDAQMAEFVRAVRLHEQPANSGIPDSVRLLETLDLLKRRIDQA